MTRPTFDVRIWATQTITGSRGKAYKVRWGVEGRERSKTLRTEDCQVGGLVPVHAYGGLAGW
jgi:hypothetical protein